MNQITWLELITNTFLHRRNKIMGITQSKCKGSIKRKDKNENEQITLQDFNILRSVGKGTFGKVCIIQKKDTKHLYGLKYMSKRAIIERSAGRNVLKELEILKMLNHQFLVNLRYSFQDEEDMFIVLDLMLGGDIRYHLKQGVRFREHDVKLYLLEIGSVLDYLRGKNILHRDIKPDNLLLDSKGHIHLTDFNIATWIPDGKLALSVSGTKPYMAPEVFKTGCEQAKGYSFEADWWSFGVTICEMLMGRRPFDIRYSDCLQDIALMFSSDDTIMCLPEHISRSLQSLLKDLLQCNVTARVNSVKQLLKYDTFKHYDVSNIPKKLYTPLFVPSCDRLNCDPTHELEEMMIESNPLYKKKQRKRRRKKTPGDSDDPTQNSIDDLSNMFTSFRRISANMDDSGSISQETIEILTGGQKFATDPTTHQE